MSNRILVAGGTGNLGKKIVHELIESGADVHLLVRKESDNSKLEKFRQAGVHIIPVSFSDTEALRKACENVSCVVSALAGLADVIVKAQTQLLEAAEMAGVPRFIPSDYSLDFTALPAGGNRNFDLRRTFHKRLEDVNISATSIFNGAFAEILGYNIPIFDFKKKTVGYWGEDPDFKLDFTTMDDTAAYSAAASLDNNTPRKLRIASFQLSPNDILKLAAEVTDSHYSLVNMGSLQAFAANNEQQRASDPAGEQQVNSRWQSGQYMHDMFSVHTETLDNQRYPELNWTSATEFISSILTRLAQPVN